MLTPEDTRVLTTLASQMGSAGTSMYTALVHKIVLEGIVDLCVAGLLALIALAGIGFICRLIKASKKCDVEFPLALTGLLLSVVVTLLAIFGHEGVVEVYAPEGVAAQQVLSALHH